MAKEAQLFTEFSPVSKEEWIEKARKDLKGRALEDLRWQLEGELAVDPFYVAGDLEALPNPGLFGKSQNTWEVGEYISIDDAGAAVEQVREGRQGGVDAPLLKMMRRWEDAELEQYLEATGLPEQSLHFAENFPGKEPLALLRQVESLLRKKGDDPAQVSGSVDFDPYLDWSEPQWDPLVAALHLREEKLPAFKVLQLNASHFHGGTEDTSQELAYTIAKGSEYLAQLDERGVRPERTNAGMQISVAVGKSYFVEIAKLRALKRLWSGVLEAYGLHHGQLPPIVAHLAPETQEDDIYTNMIRATIQGMSAAVGGVDRLYILPANAVREEPSTTFTRRIARNVQQILRLESFFDRVVDPAAGSYYIETLTEKLAEKAWGKFQELERSGGFGQ